MTQLLESMGVKPSAGDVIAMAGAARIERSTTGALAVARRLHLVDAAQRGGGADVAVDVAATDVAGLAVGMVEVCLEAGDASAADECLEVSWLG